MQGLYGPFTMAERVVQKIWLQRDFDASRDAQLTGWPDIAKSGPRAFGICSVGPIFVPLSW